MNLIKTIIPDNLSGLELCLMKWTSCSCCRPSMLLSLMDNMTSPAMDTSAFIRRHSIDAFDKPPTVHARSR